MAVSNSVLCDELTGYPESSRFRDGNHLPVHCVVGAALHGSMETPLLLSPSVTITAVSRRVLSGVRASPPPDMWINILVRTLATVALFDFMHLPLGEGALIFGMVYNFLPFMIYPIYNTMSKMDHSYIEAAQDLGANPLTVFLKVVLPLSMPGVMSGIMMVFMPTISTFAIAELLTMNNIKLFGTTIQENINNGMWNYGAALSLIMLVIIFATDLFSDNEEDRASNEGGII